MATEPTTEVEHQEVVAQAAEEFVHAEQMAALGPYSYQLAKAHRELIAAVTAMVLFGQDP